MIDQDTIAEDEKEVIEFLERFEDISMTPYIARGFFEVVGEVDRDLSIEVNENLTEIIELDEVIDAQKIRNDAVRKSTLLIILDNPMMKVVEEFVKSKLYDLRIYDDE